MNQIPEHCHHCHVDCLKDVVFLTDLEAPRKAEIMDHAVRQTYRKDEVIFREGDPVTAIYGIHSGKVKLCRYDEEGTEHIIRIFTAGETIWEGLLLEESSYPYSCVCVMEADVCRIRGEDVKKTLTDPAAALQVIHFLSKELLDANNRISLLNVTAPKARLSKFLLQRAEHIRSDVITLRLSDIASSINLRPETVSRKLKELEQEGLVEKIGQSSLRILDPEKLGE
ncbi:Crp/Fnr family transcriptional regulator [Eubacterium pyruvativorans]|uniref:Crp/Fnr family transcriptional regulator n=1 Tax=Eubacterium pyruvativorans TaxID=155865 RepID=UPI00088967AB|nr:Crp/Fnr family transcriptional regulator [Eubacterium pyruvativorans]SDF71207.1 CRP/FNR family transcriptional regulator, anaerobic regulatory protein [Eubacterium pyruvativorans]